MTTPRGGDAELGLLRRFEPTLRMTEGERFVPAPVEPFVAGCSLRIDRGGDKKILVPEGHLDVDSLAAAEAGRVGTFLQYVSEAERSSVRKVRWRLRLDGPARLARVGLFGRIADALFRLSLLLRATVPAGVAAGAERKAIDSGLHERPTYYGRVVRDGGWTVLHYMFFYAMNDWRSAFGGVNDHEGDWEQIMVFCDGIDSEFQPRWVAYASHDYHGDDLRRAWEDRELTTEGNHPVVYVGGGSHASYFLPGEYVTRIDIPALRPLMRLQRWFHHISRIEPESENLGVPFVDRATGDGAAFGPGGELEWDARLLDPSASWVADYRGLWGLDTADVTGGERAPAGPRFNRDGSVRTSWSDPVGYAGLHKVTPPACEAATWARRLEDIRSQRTELTRSFDEARDELRAQVAVGAASRSEAEAAEARLDDLAREESELESEQRRLEQGALAPVDPRAHLETPAEPEPAVRPTRRRLLNVWASISAPLILAMVAAMLLASGATAVGFAIGIAVVMAIESLLRKRLLNVAWGTAVIVLLIAVVALGLQNWQLVLGITIAAFAIFVLLGNVRELFARR